jgi:acyl-CoA dehydrogenase
MWAKMARIAADRLSAGDADKDFYKNKLVTARFFVERILPAATAHLARIEAGADTVMGLAADHF